MKRNKKALSIATMTTLSSIMALTMNTTVFAKTDAILTKDKTTGQYFQYDLTALNNDAVNKVMGEASPLYDEYMGKVVQAFHDDKKGYIDSTAVNNAAVDATMSGTTFNLDAYTESATGSTVITPTDSIQTRVLTNGSVTNGTVINTPVVEQPIADNTDITSKFTDVNFKTEIYKLIGKTSPAPILYSDVKNITKVDVNSKSINSLSGIEYFTALTSLNCYLNKLTVLDVSKNTALIDLECGANQITTLDVSKNTALTSLYCNSNQLTTLDVSKNTTLIYLGCFINQIATLDVSKNTALTVLNCWGNQIAVLDVTKNTAITFLYCASNQITTLDVSRNTALTKLFCDSNQLTTLDVSKNTTLTWLSCYNNKLTTLNINSNIALTTLNCKYNQLTTLYSIKNTWATSDYNPQYTDSTHTTTTDSLVITIKNSVINIDSDFTFDASTGTITKYIGSSTNVTIPSKIGEVSVTTIGNDAFSNSQLASITIPSSVTSIETEAFKYCRALNSIIVDINNLTYASEDGVLFNKAKTLLIQFPIAKSGSYTIPSSVNFIANSAFQYCNANTIILSNGVTKIGDNAFFNSSITSIAIPSSITTIGSRVFDYCWSLNSITVDANNVAYTSEDGVLFNKSKTELIKCSTSKSGIYVIPTSVNSIASGSFIGCKLLTSITIPSSVTSIGYYTFEYCYANITVDANNTAYASEDGVLFNKSKTKLIQCPTSKSGSYTIPSSVIYIGSSAFASCSLLTNIIIPSSVISIESGAFQGTGIITITIPSSVTSIGSYCFGNCSNLSSVYFYRNAPTAYYAFQNVNSNSNLIVYYKADKTGFTNPWNGYQTKTF